MEFVVLMFILLTLALIIGRSRAGRNKRIKEAYKFNKPNIHGTRTYASRSSLKKAGLL